MLVSPSHGTFARFHDSYHKLAKMDTPFSVQQPQHNGQEYPELEIHDPLLGDPLGAIDARCCEELECINVDLERRLENQAADYMRLEENIAQERRRWEQKVADAEKNCNDWRDMYNREKKLKQNVDDRLRRAEMDLYHILQKKYDIVKEAKAEVKKEMLDSEKIKKDLGIRDHIMSRARRITGTTSTKARHIGTPRAGIPQESSPEETRAVQAISVLVDFFAL